MNFGYKRDHKYEGWLELVVNDRVVYSKKYYSPKERTKLFARYTWFLFGKTGYINLIPNWDKSKFKLSKNEHSRKEGALL